MKKWLITALAGVFIIPLFIFSRDKAVAIMEAPERLKKVEKRYIDTYEQQNTYIQEQRQANNRYDEWLIRSEERWQRQQAENERQYDMLKRAWDNR